MAVVRCGGQKESVLEPRRDSLEHPRKIGVAAKAGRGEVVGLVNDEQVPAESAVLPRLGDSSKLLEHIWLLQVMVRGDDAFVRPPGVGVDSQLTLKPHLVAAIHQLEGQRELLFHLFAPLRTKRGGRDHQHSSDATPEH